MLIRPFHALRPPRDRVEQVAAPPYDVVDTAEAAKFAAGNPDSFLHVSRPEIDLGPEGDAHSDAAYAKARSALEDFVRRGVLVRDDAPVLLVYRQQLGEMVQTGVVGCVSAAEYRAGLIATHEYTRPDKEDDRTRHIDVLSAHDEPVMLMYRPHDAGAEQIAATIASVAEGEPAYDLTADGVRHTLWPVDDPDAVGRFVEAFALVPALYVADGHHRCAAAARVAERRDEDEAGVFPATVFASDQLTVMAYNRVVRDLAGYDGTSFLAALEESFDVRPSEGAPVPGRHEFGVYIAGSWHLLAVRKGLVDDADAIARLDVAILAERVLTPLLGIVDQRRDERISFVGGIRGTAELERLVDSGAFAVAFALHPTSADDVMGVADLGEVMPPKSTWFEPKLRSGLFVHAID